ncbi:MAG: 50S ribosome-binding GTPase [Candidatus Omnitrophica bacterium]|nr:50S ribosome-binding GTPase [Candidatus Omnitrophota bacterium]MCF7878766.1 50S ribosome-binding GTPase [Candidatus Omnitrophota bacterium]
MIVDKVQILFKSGGGGRGSNSVKKISSAKFLPDGGDGGRGADIILKVSPHLYDLAKLKGKKKITAPSGEPGARRSKSGKNAEPLFIDLPKGTQVLDENKKLLLDLSKEGQQFKLCAGGFGGRGSVRKPATTDPKAGQAKLVTLDYRIPADVSILGLANSQKTTLFNLLTGQKNKVADYPFTTAACALGHFSYNFKKITVLDTPPVRETKGGSDKNRFLRHLLRVKIIVVLGGNDGFKQVKKEIYKFNPKILDEKKVFYLPENVDRININQLKKKLYN